MSKTQGKRRGLFEGNDLSVLFIKHFRNIKHFVEVLKNLDFICYFHGVSTCNFLICNFISFVLDNFMLFVNS